MPENRSTADIMAQFREFIDASPVETIVLDAQCRVVHTNSLARQMFDPPLTVEAPIPWKTFAGSTTVYRKPTGDDGAADICQYVIAVLADKVIGQQIQGHASHG